MSTSDPGGQLRARLHARTRNLLRDAGHDRCPGLGGARWDVENDLVDCGCDLVFPVPPGTFTLGMARLIEQDEALAVTNSNADDDVMRSAEAILAGRGSAYGELGPSDLPWPPPPAVSPSWPPSPIVVEQQPATDVVLTAPATSSPVTAADPIAATLALIDPSQIYTPDDLEKRLLDVIARLERGAVFERQCVINLYEARTTFHRAYWQAVASSEGGAADMRKAQAMVDCTKEHQAMVEAEMLEKAAKATMHNLRSILSGYQSVARSVGLDYQAGGSNR